MLITLEILGTDLNRSKLYFQGKLLARSRPSSNLDLSAEIEP